MTSPFEVWKAFQESFERPGTDKFVFKKSLWNIFRIMIGYKSDIKYYQIILKLWKMSSFQKLKPLTISKSISPTPWIISKTHFGHPLNIQINLTEPFPNRISPFF